MKSRSSRRMILALMLLSALTGASFGDETPSQHYWGFLVKDRDPEGFSPKEMMEMQKAHLANFRRLGEAGQLLTAGPLADPEKMLRGIVILKMGDTSNLDDMFAPDPFVANNLLKLQVAPMTITHGTVKRGSKEGGQFDELVLVAVPAASQLTDDELAKHQALLDGHHEEGELRFAAQINASTNWSHILIYSKQDADALRQALAKSPAMNGVAEKVQFMPLYTGKDTFPVTQTAGETN